MANTLSSTKDLIGGTPTAELGRLTKALGAGARVLAKLEQFNLAGSAKDRVAQAMLDAAEADGRLKRGGVIVEPTSGNTGIALAALAGTRGYSAVIVMPDNMSAQRRALIRAYGAELVLTPAAEGMAGAAKRAGELAGQLKNSFLPDQFSNPANPACHYRTTGPEILEAAGRVDVFVAGVGTGGTITGAGRYLRENCPGIEIVAVEPALSPVLSGGAPGMHGIQGIGAGFVPPVLDRTVYHRVTAVTQQEASAAAGMLARWEGILAGISSGAALWAALQLARQPEYTGKTIVALLPDGGERYLPCGS